MKRIISGGYSFSSISNKIFIDSLFDDKDFIKKYYALIAKIIKAQLYVEQKTYEAQVLSIEYWYINNIDKLLIMYGNKWSESLQKDLFNYLLNDLRNKFGVLIYTNK